MKDVLSRSTYLVLAGLIPTAMALSASASDADANRTIRQAAPESAVGGLTVEQQAVRQADLHARLTTEMPRGAMNAPIRVELTQQNRTDLAQPYQPGTPLRIGVVNPITPRIEAIPGQALPGGVIQKTRDGGFIWATTLTSPNAQAIRVHLTNFSLPPNVEMFFYGPNGQAHGPYVGLGRNGTGEFWTRSISSDTGIIQLRVDGQATQADRQNISFAIADLGHIQGRRTLPARAGGPSAQNHDSWPCSDNAPCMVDVNCVNTGPAGPAEDAIAKMEWIQGPYINTCTGGLLTDTDAGSQIPYFLTAYHCNVGSISNLETFFNYTTSSCNGDCPDSLVTGGTPPPASTVGVTLVAAGSAADFTLLTLDESPPAGAVFLGWNNSPIAFTNGANLYRVSNANFGPQVYSQHDVDTSSPECQGWSRGNRIYSADQTGGTMGGSSGSPVVNSAGEVVGQLSGCCGYNCADECDSGNNWTVDGAFAAYWDQVSEFLDPQGGGGCDNDGSCGPGEDCNNCPNDCRAKTNGSPSSRYCCDGDLPDCGDSRCSENGWSCGGGGGEVCGNGTCGSGEDECNCSADCGTPPSSEAGLCDDGIDNDCGGGTDCNDSDCAGDPACQGCSLGQHGDPCNSNSDCCSGRCKHNGTCR